MPPQKTFPDRSGFRNLLTDGPLPQPFTLYQTWRATQPITCNRPPAPNNFGLDSVPTHRRARNPIARVEGTETLRHFSVTLSEGLAGKVLSSTADWLRSRVRKVSSVERSICAPRDAICSIRSDRRPIKEDADSS